MVPLRKIKKHKIISDEGTRDQLKPFSIEYRYAGRTFLLNVMAESFDDAKARIRSAHFNGEPLKRFAGIGGFDGDL